MKWDVRDGMSEVGIEDFECSHPTSRFPFQNSQHLKKTIELGPEKWEMRLKQEFSSLKYYPLWCARACGHDALIPYVLSHQFIIPRHTHRVHTITQNHKCQLRALNMHFPNSLMLGCVIPINTHLWLFVSEFHSFLGRGSYC